MTIPGTLHHDEETTSDGRCRQDVGATKRDIRRSPEIDAIEFSALGDNLSRPKAQRGEPTRNVAHSLVFYVATCDCAVHRSEPVRTPNSYTALLIVSNTNLRDMRHRVDGLLIVVTVGSRSAAG